MLRFREDLAKAYLLKEKFYAFMASENSSEARILLHEFVIHAIVADLPAFEPLLTVLRNRTQFILNAFDCKFTNRFTEGWGCNNKVKVLKRIAFGFRSFTNLRQRILLSFNTP